MPERLRFIDDEWQSDESLAMRMSLAMRIESLKACAERREAARLADEQEECRLGTETGHVAYQLSFPGSDGRRILSASRSGHCLPILVSAEDVEVLIAYLQRRLGRS